MDTILALLLVGFLIGVVLKAVGLLAISWAWFVVPGLVAVVVAVVFIVALAGMMGR